MTTIQGTTFLVHGTWYLRHLGGGGSMIILNASSELKNELQDNALVTLDGHILRDGQGCAQSFSAKALAKVESDFRDTALK